MNELYHHGIPGQIHGHRNGPPYPLSYDKLSAEEKKAAKDSAINRGDLKEVHKNREHFSDQEINSAINRYNLYTRLSELSSDKSKNKLKKGMKAVDSIASNLGKMANLVQSGSRLYNNTAPVLNTFAGTTLKPIRFDNGNNKSMHDKAKGK